MPFELVRITKPRGREFDRVWNIYAGSFPSYEREPKRRLMYFASGARFDIGDVHSEPHLVTAKYDGEVVGGRMFGYLEAGNATDNVPFGYSQYTFVRNNRRRMGFGRRIHESTMDALNDLARNRGLPGVEIMLNEIKKPPRARSGPTVHGVAGEESDSLMFWHKMGYRAVDPERFVYAVPALGGGREPLEGLMLCARPVGRNFGGKIPTGYLRSLMRGFVLGMFEGIPGSDIDGHRDPDTDPATVENEKVLDFLEGRKIHSLDLIPLTELVPRHAH